MNNQIIGYDLVNDDSNSENNEEEEVLSPYVEKNILDKFVEILSKYKSVVGKSPKKIAEMVLSKISNIPMSNKTKAEILGIIAAAGTVSAATALSIYTKLDIDAPKIKTQKEYIDIDRTIEEIEPTGEHSLGELAESAGIRRQDIIEHNGFNSENEAIGKYAKVPYKIEKGDNYFFYEISATPGKTYNRLELERIADSHEISLETLLEINVGNYIHDEEGYHFKHDSILVTVFPTKDAQTFLRMGSKSK